MSPDEWREVVGEHLTERRQELGIRSMRRAAEDAGISEAVWRQVETGKRQVRPGEWIAPNPSPDIQAAICRRLFWRADGIQRLLAGQRPEQLDIYRVPESSSVRIGQPGWEKAWDDDAAMIDAWIDAANYELEFMLSELGFDARAEVMNFTRRLWEAQIAELRPDGEGAAEWRRKNLARLEAATRDLERFAEARRVLTSPPPDEFALAADGGLPEEVGPEQNRPSPDPEPDGP